MKKYKIIQEGEDYNIIYTDGVLTTKEYHSKDGINGLIREGYYESVEQYKLKCDVEFGNKLVDEFLIDNRISPIAFKPQLSMNVLQKFQVVKALAEVGDIKNVMLMLGLIEVDELFTQERKDKYISMCEKHLAL